MLQTTSKRTGTTSKQSLLSRRGGQRWGVVGKAVKKHVVSPVVKHVVAPVAKAVVKHVIAPVAKAASTAYKAAGNAVEGIGNHLEDIANVRKGGSEGRGCADKKDASRRRGGARREKQRKCDPGSTSHARVPHRLGQITPSYTYPSPHSHPAPPLASLRSTLHSTGGGRYCERHGRGIDIRRRRPGQGYRRSGESVRSKKHILAVCFECAVQQLKQCGQISVLYKCRGATRVTHTSSFPLSPPFSLIC